MGEKERAERLKVQIELQEAMWRGDQRYLRARRFTDQILHLMYGFIPNDRACTRIIEEMLMETAFQANIEIINVRPEWDELDKLKIEHAINESKMMPVTMPIVD